MKTTIGLEEREWIAHNAIKEVGKDERKFRVIDIEVLRKKFREDRYKSGLASTLTILPFHDDKRKDRSYTFTCFNDRQFDVIHGIYIGLDKNGEPRFKRMEIKGSQDFDFTRPDDLDYWLIARWHPQITGSPNQFPSPYFKIFDPTEEIIGSTAKVESLMTAVGRIKAMDLKKKVLFLRYLQIPIHSTYTEDIIDGLLYQSASGNPSLFNEKYSSSSRSIYEIFYTALTLGVIQQIPDQGYRYENYKLGTVEFDVIATLNKDNVILSSILDKIAKVDLTVKDIETRSKRLSDVKTANKPIKEVEEQKLEPVKAVNKKITEADNNWS